MVNNTSNFTSKDIFNVNKIWHKYEASFYSEKHDEIFVDEQNLWKDVAKQYLSGNNLSLLDFGCGTGFVTMTIQPFISPSSTIVLADPSPEMLASAKKCITFKNTSYRLIDDETYSQTDFINTFDYILINSVMHHLPDLTKACQMLSFFLKTGGKIIIAHEPNLNHFQNSTIKGIKKIVYALQKRKSNVPPSNISEEIRPIFKLVNQELKDQGIINQELTPHEIQSLVDYHSPTARKEVDQTVGFSRKTLLATFNKFGNFSVTKYQTYRFLGKIKTKHNQLIDKIFRIIFPNSGSKLFMIITKIK